MIKKILALCIALAFGLLFLSPPLQAYDALCSKVDSNGNLVSAWQGNVCTDDKGPCGGKAANSAVCQQDQKQQALANNDNPVAGPNGILQIVTNIIALITGAVAIIMIIYSGLQMVSSSGNPERVKKARANLIAAIVGVVIVAVSWTAVTFVVQKFIH